MLVSAVPFSPRLPLPMRRTQVTVQTHPVRDAFDQPPRTATAGVPLVAVHELVGDDAGNLGSEAGGRDAVDVGEGEVDFFVVGVELGLCGWILDTDIGGSRWLGREDKNR